MSALKQVRVVEIRASIKGGHYSLTTTRLHIVDQETWTTGHHTWKDPKRTPTSRHRRTTRTFTLDIVPAGTVLLEEKFSGSENRPKTVSYALHVYDGRDFHFIAHPEEFQPSSLKIIHNTLPLYFHTRGSEADVTIKGMASRPGVTVFIDHNTGSEHQKVYGTDIDKLVREAKILAQQFASEGGCLVREYHRL